MTLPECFDQLDFGGQMIGITGTDPAKFSDPFGGYPFGLRMNHTMDNPVAHQSDAVETQLFFEPAMSESTAAVKSWASTGLVSGCPVDGSRKVI